MGHENILLLIIVSNLFIFFCCVARIGQSSRRVRLKIRNKYTLVGSGSLFGAFGFWVFPFHGGELCGLAVFVASVAFSMYLDGDDWTDGPPPSAFKGESDEASSRVHD